MSSKTANTNNTTMNKVGRKSSVSKGDDQDPFIDVTYMVDITGSMGPQMEAVQEAVRGNVGSFLRNPDFAGLLRFNVLPYTESSSKSFASFHSFTNGEDALTFISQLRLCRPPSYPQTNASGCDGPENVKAALSVLRKNISDIPMIVFFITDAGWHRLDRSCGSYDKTTKAELKFLKENDQNLPNYDMWTIWNTLPHDMIFFNPVLFGRPDFHSYGQMAKSTNGVMAYSNSATVQQITDLMTNVVSAIVSLLEGTNDFKPPTNFPGFQIYDCSSVKMQEDENAQMVGQPVCLNTPDAVAKFLNTQITQCVSMINGKGWRKRVVPLNARALHQQTRLYGELLHYFLGKTGGDEKVAAITKLVEDTRNEMPEDQKGHFSVTMEKISEIKAVLASTDVPEGFRDNVSLMTVKELAKETTIEEIYDDFVATVCATLMGYPMDIAFPVDAAGNTDFMSAWDARVNNMGPTLLSVESFQTMLNNAGTGQVKDPATREDFNSLVIVSGPPGSLQWSMYRLSSMMQIGNFAACYGVKADVTKGFIPNLAPGVACGAFKWLVHQPMTETIYDRARNILYTFDALDKTPAQAVLAQLKKCQANPEDTVFKMMLLWYRELRNTELAIPSLNQIFREWLQGLVQMKFGKRTEENNVRYNAELIKLFGFGGMGDFGELNTLNLLEKEWSAETDAIITAHLKSPEVLTLLTNHPIFTEFKSCIQNSWTLLFSDLSDGVPALVDFDKAFPDALSTFTECFLLRLRKLRYDTIKHSEKQGDYTHVLKEEMPSSSKLLFDNLQNIHYALMREREAARVTDAKNKMIKQVVETLVRESGSDEQFNWNEYLSKLVAFTATRSQVVLQRRDLVVVPDLYASKNTELRSVLITGDWSPDAPQSLRSFRVKMMELMQTSYSQDEIMIALLPIDAALVCQRVQPNRHGHSADPENLCLSIFPAEFNETYASRRIKNKPSKSNYIEMMREFKKTMDFWIESDHDAAKVRAIAFQYKDANDLHKFTAQLIKEFKTAEE